MIYARFKGGKIESTYPGITDPENWPGLVAISKDDPRLVAFAASFSHGPSEVPILPVEVTERVWRDTEIASVAWLRDRHRDELELGDSTTINTTEYKQLLSYIKELRNWPESGLFPLIEHRPSRPDWLNTALAPIEDDGSTQ